jgi:predicted ATP-dependent endonuclease of OLD family
MKRVLVGRDNVVIANYIKTASSLNYDKTIIFYPFVLNGILYNAKISEVIQNIEAAFVISVEAGLHPKDQREYIQDLVNKSEKYNTDIFCATHSPYIVDAFNIDEVILFNNNRIKTLSSHKDVEKWERYMTTGEIWSYLGEDWV